MNEWFSASALLHVVFVSVFLLTKRKRDISDYVLAVWLVFILLPFLGRALAAVTGSLFVLQLKLETTPLTYGPFMLMYAQLIIRSKAVKVLSYWPHFLPFLLFSFLQIFGAQPINQYGPFRIEMLSVHEQFFNWSVLSSITAYSLVILAILLRHRKDLKNHFSYSSTQTTLIWLFLLVIFNLAGFFTLTLIDLSVIRIPFAVHGLLPFCFIYVLSFFGLRQPLVFKDGLAKEREEGALKYINSGLSEQSAETYSLKLLEYMEKTHPYLDDELTIEALAGKLSIPRHYLTQIINGRFNKNFYTFINEYRVLAVKKKIDTGESENFTLMSLALDCGFNSKATFNSAFRKHTGMTPSEYRKLVQA